MRLYSTPEHGLYSGMSLDALNLFIRNRQGTEEQLRRDAADLLRAQRWLADHGKHFVVVVAASKPFVYAHGLGSQHVLGGDCDAVDRAVGIGRILAAEGVNVIDGQAVLRQLVKERGIETHAFAGVHWNYYAGCTVAAKLLDQVRSAYRQEAPALDCGPGMPSPLRATDMDGLGWLNIWTDGGLSRPTPYAEATARPTGWRPRMVIVGDSFSEQLIQPLQQAGVYDRLVISRYLRTREVMDKDWAQVTAKGEAASANQIWPELIGDIAAADIVVLQVADYNLGRRWYDFANGLEAAVSGGKGGLRLVQVTGQHGREENASEWWHWIDGAARFDVLPSFLAEKSRRTRISFGYGTLDRQKIEVVVTAAGGVSGRTQLSVPAATDRASFERVFDIDPATIQSVELRTDGRSRTLGPGDERRAALVVRNLALVPQP